MVDSPEGGAFSDEDGRILHEAAARLGGVVERAREIEERTAHLNAATAVRRLLEEGSRALSAEEAGETLARVARHSCSARERDTGRAEDRIIYIGLDAPEQFEQVARERLVGTPAREFRLWRRATRQPKPIFVENARASQLIPNELVELLGLRSYVAFPLLSSERPLGIVICATREGRHWTLSSAASSISSRSRDRSWSRTPRCASDRSADR